MRYILTQDNLILIFNEEVFNINKEHVFYSEIIKELSSKEIDEDKIYEYINIKESLLNYTGNALTIKNSKFFYKWRGKEIELGENNSYVKRILNNFKEKKPFNSFILFLDNLVKNPLKTVINELGLFLDANEIEITEDGYFLAYKKVREDFKDIYSGTFDNSVGKIVSMPRKEVEYNRENTCSNGLHFCSKSYLNYYRSNNSVSDRIVIVKINPKDVVSIPSDYNNAKGRCCKYEVIGELKEEQDLKEFLINKELKVYNTVEEARKYHKDRKIGGQFYIFNKRKNEYRLYEFIDGTSNKHMKCINIISLND